MAGADGPWRTHGHYAEANGLNIYFGDFGSGVPLILLHGGAATSSMWEPRIPALAERFRVIAPDARGHGRTNNPAGALSYRLLADDVAGLIEAIGLSEPLVFGLSDGGQTALELGMRHAGLCAALVVGSVWYKHTDGLKGFLREFGFLGPADVDVGRIEAANPDLLESIRTSHLRDDDPEYWKTLLREISALWWTPLNYTEADFRRILDPTLVMIGDRDGIIPTRQAVEMYEFIPTAELAVLPNTTHFDALSDLMMTNVVDFLVRHSP